jgi:hypothetical protein
VIGEARVRNILQVLLDIGIWEESPLKQTGVMQKPCFPDHVRSRAITAILLELFVKLAGGARDVNAAGDVTLTVFHALHDPRGFAAFGTVGALGSVHDFVSACCFGDLCHCESLLGAVLWLAATVEMHRGGSQGQTVNGLRKSQQKGRNRLPAWPQSYFTLG